VVSTRFIVAQHGFRKSGICPLNPLKPLQSNFVADPPNLYVCHTVKTEPEVNELLLTSPKGLSKSVRAQYGTDLQPWTEQVNVGNLGEATLENEGGR
jgi:hypothetical protein